MLQAAAARVDAPSRDEHEADRKPLRDVVYGDRDAYQDPERLLDAERNTNSHSLCEGVEGHDSDDE